jgi:large subunit ribosomal protein L32e
MKKPVTTTADKETSLGKYVKKNKPKFVRQESWRYKRLKENWRRPRGLDNKMRRKIKGWPPTVNTGYRGPKVSRGLHPSGYREVLVHNLKELKEIDPKTQVIRIAHKVGNRKKAKMLPEAKKKKITILNVKEIKEFRKKEEAEEEIEPEESEQKKTNGEQKNDGRS